jgi:hypothetical protein
MGIEVSLDCSAVSDMFALSLSMEVGVEEINGFKLYQKNIRAVEEQFIQKHTVQQR